MYLIVGLGNPGKKYDGTRHNIGFEVIDSLVVRNQFPQLRATGKAAAVKGRLCSQDVVLARPATFMNLSGDAVGPLMRFYQLDTQQLVVVHDELDFEPGKVKLKSGGGHGGHNGLRSIMNHCGRDFIRVRVGIGKPPRTQDGADFVLSRFDKATRVLMDEAVGTALEGVELIVEHGMAKAMALFNQPNH